MKLGMTVTLLLALSVSIFATTTTSNGYTKVTSITPIDVLNSTYSPFASYDCVSKNCWISLASTTSFYQLATSPDGETQAIDASGYRWRWVISSQSWVKPTDSLQGSYKAIHIGSYASNTYLAITTGSSGNIYSWSGTAWTQLSTTANCQDGAITPDGTAYCISSGNVYVWSGTTWNHIRTTGDSVTITANLTLIAIVDSSGNVFTTPVGSSTWTQATSLGITFSQTVGSLQISDDDTIVGLDSSGNVQVSHDDGNSWTSVDLAGATIESVATGGPADTFALTSARHVFHLNTIINQTTVTVTGQCTNSHCTSNPTVDIQQWVFDPNATSTSFIGTSGGGGNGVQTCGVWGANNGPFCEFVISLPAHTAVNSFISAASTTCDAFAPGASSNECTGNLVADIAIVGGISLMSSSEDCNCGGGPQWYNQKYVITSSTTGAPTQSKWFGSVTHTYYWKNVTMSQWCNVSPNLLPDLTILPGAVTIEYQKSGTAPTSMPGAYINGDVRAWQSVDHSLVGLFVYVFTGKAMIYNSATGYGPTTFYLNGGIYTWDGTTAKRGSGGNPITPCQGY